jgi:hypothetical protein
MTSQTWEDYPDGFGVNHNWLSVEMNKHFAEYFVYLARHNQNSFEGGYVGV